MQTPKDGHATSSNVPNVDFEMKSNCFWNAEEMDWLLGMSDRGAKN